jgi:ComF family protein
MKTSVLSVVQDFVSLFFPRYCLACELALVKGEEMICTECLLEMPRSDAGSDEAFFSRLYGRLPVGFAFSLYRFSKGSRVQRLLHALKYEGQDELGVALGRLAGYDLREKGLQKRVDLIVPVPLFEKRKRVRGYNQSERFAQGLAEVLGIPCCDTAMRCTKTESQTRRGKLHRWLNVKDSFEVTRPELVSGKRILLVDDIITTGSTVEACGQTLLAAGCGGLDLVVIAAAS